VRARLLLVALALGAAVLGCVAAADVLGTASNQCDNMAGTCIRERQQLAIAVVRAACVVVAALPLWLLVLAVAGRLDRGRRTALAVTVLVACAAVAVAALAAQPVDHLNDRWGGWLAG
jgi:O-antigen/teichoic acid export membrane protein